jgi:hypothetical protein
VGVKKAANRQRGMFSKEVDKLTGLAMKLKVSCSKYLPASAVIYHIFDPALAQANNFQGYCCLPQIYI